MTKSEAMTLREGQRVETQYGNFWKAVFVECVIYFDQATALDYGGTFKPGDVNYIRVRKPGRQQSGSRYPSVRRWPDQIRFVPTDNNAANVFADFLEDHDEPVAAMKLRKAFPSCDGVNHDC